MDLICSKKTLFKKVQRSISIDIKRKYEEEMEGVHENANLSFIIKR